MDAKVKKRRSDYKGDAGIRRHPLYMAWWGMRDRCANPNNKKYHLYGGRGIKVCDRWLTDVLTFIADMGPKPSPQHSLDRIESNGDYEPGNCRWATLVEQNNNRSCCVYIKLGNEVLTPTQWARRSGIPDWLVRDRYRRGWSAKDAVYKPIAHKRKPLRDDLHHSVVGCMAGAV